MNKLTKYAFVNDYESKIWSFTGKAYDEALHVDNGSEQYTYAILTDKQLEIAFSEPGLPEPGYGYVMLKNGKVRQISF